jgi:hypothetical protein
MLRSFLGTLVSSAGILWYASSAANSAPEPQGATEAPSLAAAAQALGKGGSECVGNTCDSLEPAVYRVSDLEDAPLDPARMKNFRRGRMRGLLGDDTPGQTPQWVLGLPPDFTQTERSAQARGVNPCMSPDPGFGDYGAWDYTPSLGQMLVPEKLERDADGKISVMFHFHGHDPIRKEWVQAIKSSVLVGLDLGINSGPYLKKFESESTFQYMLSNVESALEKRLGEKIEIGKLGLSSWSAGYGAVQRVLESSLASRVDTVILLDGLHTGYTNTEGAKATLAPFVRFARRAANGDAFMHVSHSSILPPGYASTTETANYLIWQMGGVPEERSARDNDPMGLRLMRAYDKGDFHVEGYTGNGKLDHCAQLGVYREVLKNDVAKRWNLTTVK